MPEPASEENQLPAAAGSLLEIPTRGRGGGSAGDGGRRLPPRARAMVGAWRPLPSRSSSPRPFQRGQGWWGRPRTRRPPHRWGGPRWRWVGWWRRRRRWGGWGAGSLGWAAGGRAEGRRRGEAGWWPPANGRASWASAGATRWRWAAPGPAPGGELWREDRERLSSPRDAGPGPSVAVPHRGPTGS